MLLIESGLVEGLDGVVLNGLLIEQTGDDPALEEVLLHDFGDILHLYHGIEAALGIDDHDRAERAQAKAAGGDDIDLVLETESFDFFLKLVDDCQAVRGGTTGTAAYKYIRTIHYFPPYFVIAPMVYSVTTFLLTR